MKTFVILNPAAGRNRAGRLWSSVEGALRDAIGDFGIRATESGGDIETIINHALRDGYRRFIGVGGDGTISGLMDAVMANGNVAPSDVVIGQIPCGTVNVVANCLGLSSPRRAIEALRHGTTKPVDVMRLDAVDEDGNPVIRHGFVIVSIGLPVDASRLTAKLPAMKLLGGASYVLAGVLSVLGGGPRQFTLARDESPQQTAENWGYFFCDFPGLKGEISFAPEALYDDGLVDCVEIGPVSRLRMLTRILPGMKDGSYVRKPGINVSKGKTFRVESKISKLVEVDGEPAGMTPVTISVVSKAAMMSFHALED